MLRYLTTGDNDGDPQLDLKYASYVRTSLPEARAIADKAILECDNTSGGGPSSTASSSKAPTLNSTSAESGIPRVITDSYGAEGRYQCQVPRPYPRHRGYNLRLRPGCRRRNQFLQKIRTTPGSALRSPD